MESSRVRWRCTRSHFQSLYTTSNKVYRTLIYPKATATDPEFPCCGTIMFPIHFKMVLIFPVFFDDKARNYQVTGPSLAKKIMFFMNTKILNLQSSLSFRIKNGRLCVSNKPFLCELLNCNILLSLLIV